MVIRLFSTLLAALLASCALPPTYSDTASVQERKSYVACAVTRAFLDRARDTPPEEAARSALRQCDSKRQTLLHKLIEENAGKPFGMRFVEAYMDELHAAMIAHIALRLAQSRARQGSGTNT